MAVIVILYTASRSHITELRWSKSQLCAVNPMLTLRWRTSLKMILLWVRNFLLRDEKL